ncbi:MULTISPECIES: hypothetical protein [Caulobacter]|jgi:hypothetical protein|uniref:Uncharacterized protein n=1 Tax=Caulobacter vibrioides OR37 TaxID=1292034 RepID=R0EDL9_CAUVI|nr:MULTISPECIES: hypothetical protein [Caulobacter]ENZ83543.1 hypothetical protein OR37_00044 [Caulobacter vibrioides OR37]MBQ1561426.1 hypothetical protein [Caulobacter sp.]
MAEPDFEARLTRLFAEAPSFPDAALFNAEVSAKLDRGWAMRRLFIGAAGVAAGLIAAFQILSTRFSSEIAQISRDGSHGIENEINAGYAKVASVFTSPGSVEAVWLAAGLALVALAFAVTRAVEEL